MHAAILKIDYRRGITVRGISRRLGLWIFISSVLCSVSSYGQTPTPTVASDKPTPQANKAPKPAEHNKKQESDSSIDWGLTANVILVLFTGGLFHATYRLSKSTEALVKGANDTAKRQLRAYVGCDHISILANPIRGEFLIRNFGQTIAKDVQVRLAGAIENVQPLTSFDSGILKCKTVIMPGEAARWDAPVEIAEHDVDLLSQGIGSIKIWGRVDYEDVFGELHWTTFRFVSDGGRATDHTMGINRPGWKTITCHEGNDAD